MGYIKPFPTTAGKRPPPRCVREEETIRSNSCRYYWYREFFFTGGSLLLEVGVVGAEQSFVPTNNPLGRAFLPVRQSRIDPPNRGRADDIKSSKIIREGGTKTYSCKGIASIEN